MMERRSVARALNLILGDMGAAAAARARIGGNDTINLHPVR
jgi:hypothetical protein